MCKVGQLFAWQTAHAVNEPLPGAVTIPAGERIEFIRGAADAVPTEVFKLAESASSAFARAGRATAA
jgi:hypothetical protein